MRLDPIKQYVVLRNKLLNEKLELEARLTQINRALGPDGTTPAAAAHRATRAKSKRLENPMSMKDAILRVTKDKPLTKDEILKAIHKIGYRFATEDPFASLSTRLYTDRAFKNHGGKFGPA